MDQSISGFNGTMEIFGSFFYGVTATNNLIRFHSSNPAGILSSSRHYRDGAPAIPSSASTSPGNGELFGLGTALPSAASTVLILLLARPPRGAATKLLNGASFGFDFNPVPDRIRIVSDLEQNLRVNPDNAVASSTADSSTMTRPPMAIRSTLNAGLNPTDYGLRLHQQFLRFDRYHSLWDRQFPEYSGHAVSAKQRSVAHGRSRWASIRPTSTGSISMTWPDGSQHRFAAFCLQWSRLRFFSPINLATGSANQISTASIGGAGPVLLRGLAAVPIGTIPIQHSDSLST